MFLNLINVEIRFIVYLAARVHTMRMQLKLGKIIVFICLNVDRTSNQTLENNGMTPQIWKLACSVSIYTES